MVAGGAAGAAAGEPAPVEPAPLEPAPIEMPVTAAPPSLDGAAATVICGAAVALPAGVSVPDATLGAAGVLGVPLPAPIGSLACSAVTCSLHAGSSKARAHSRPLR